MPEHLDGHFETVEDWWRPLNWLSLLLSSRIHLVAYILMILVKFDAVISLLSSLLQDWHILWRSQVIDSE